jgi:hypothetical protein
MTLPLAIAAVIGCQRGKAPPPTMPPAQVTVARPVLYPVQHYLDYNGFLDAVETVQIKARVKGFLNEIYFKEGEEVKEKALLYQIDPREYQAGVAKSKADIAKAKADIENSKAQIELAKAELERVNRELQGGSRPRLTRTRPLHSWQRTWHSWTPPRRMSILPKHLLRRQNSIWNTPGSRHPSMVASVARRSPKGTSSVKTS